MYTNDQVQPLLALVAQISSMADDEGCDGGYTVTSKTSIDEAATLAGKLQNSQLTLTLGTHVHRHGESVYAFAVGPGESFGEADFAARLGDQLESGELTKVEAYPDREITVFLAEPAATAGTDVDALAAAKWDELCNAQGWNHHTQTVHLEGFLLQKGLMAQFAAYAAQAAAEENADVAALG
ncbi:hypothetical protein ABIC83_002995 [Roseateles asaccharophilus]|uniref:hypothetical protein n=1 Tax=Roseateles asaccharophilus TaxID=582607 RepID=UPI003832BA1B